ncbi:sugar lactone lactonase YvrE [Catenulispora sp. GP43]|uniref:SMP-30/gluconolactonase/LRE family protein n=1 Tax=Catenulispora sp. GP43 TaxID=3156263 RepID=UPI003514F86D
MSSFTTTRQRLQRLAAIAACGLCLTLDSVTAAGAATWPVSDPHVITQFSFTDEQTPENIALEPDGTADLSLSYKDQIVRVGLDGSVKQTIPLPSSPDTGCAFGKHTSLAMGLVRDHRGDLYALLCTGDSRQGVWRITPQGVQTQIAALPATGFPNGIAFDEQERYLYVTDSLLGTISRVDPRSHAVSTWSDDSSLASTGVLGVNGIKVHDGALYVTNTDRGTLLRIPIRADGSHGCIETLGSGLTGIDDIAFTSPRPDADILVALNTQSQVDLFDPATRTATPVLTKADNLSNPSSAAVRGDTVYVASAGYFTKSNPNLLVAHLEQTHTAAGSGR